jgi:hypothetical protein
MLMCSPAPEGEDKLFSVDTSNLADGKLITSYVRRETMDLDTPTKTKTVRRIYPRVQATTGTEIGVRVGVQNTPDEPVRWSAERMFMAGIDNSVDIFASGKYISVQFTTTAQPEWSLSGFDLSYTVRGNW